MQTIISKNEVTIGRGSRHAEIVAALARASATVAATGETLHRTTLRWQTLVPHRSNRAARRRATADYNAASSAHDLALIEERRALAAFAALAEGAA